MRTRWLLMLLVLGAGPALAVERMSAEESALRERLDQAMATRDTCLAAHQVEAHHRLAAGVCLAEQEAARPAIDAFNAFMQVKRDALSFQERRRQYLLFQDQYRIYPLEDLQRLHRESCVTKWGGSDSPECQAIAAQIDEKKRKTPLPEPNDKKQPGK